MIKQSFPPVLHLEATVLTYIKYHTLRSSSPANAQFTTEKLLTAWSIIR